MFSGNCHCRDSQKATGSAYVPAFGVRLGSVKVAGAVKCYDNPADSGNTFSCGFCPTCGGRVLGTSSGVSQFILITAGSLDDPSRFKPTMDFSPPAPSRGITWIPAR